MDYTLENLEDRYELELERVLNEIDRAKAKNVLLQLPDGLKPWAILLSDYIEKKSGVEVRIWLGDCFGSCDLPESNCDLVVQFGHAKW